MVPTFYTQIKTFIVCRHVYANSRALFFLIYVLLLLLLPLVMETPVSGLSPIPPAGYTHVHARSRFRSP